MKALFVLSLSTLSHSLNIYQAIMGQTDDAKPTIENVENQKAMSLTGKHSCLDAINRVKSEPSVDWKSKVGNGELFVDQTFSLNKLESLIQLQWYKEQEVDLLEYQYFYTTGYVLHDLQEKLFREDINPKWVSRNITRQPITLFGTDITPHNIEDGSLKNHYFLSAIVSVAQKKERLRKMFAIKELNKEGIIPVIMYVKGLPKVIVLDDALPLEFFSDNAYEFQFSRMGKDGSAWAMFLEKAWAKVNGYYHKIEFGTWGEAMRSLTGAPTRYYSTAKIADANRIFEMILSGGESDIRSATTTSKMAKDKRMQQKLPQKNLYGLQPLHSYQVLGAYELEGRNGPVKLIRMKSSWQKEMYMGPWSNMDERWTQEMRQQIPHDDPAEGVFYIDPQHFMEVFEIFEICMHKEDAMLSYVEAEDTTSAFEYVISVPSTVEAHIMIDIYDQRMFPPTCTKGYTKMQAWLLTKDGVEIDQIEVSLFYGYAIFNVDELKAGDYVLKGKFDWAQNWDHSYAVRIYAPYSIPIMDVKMNPISEQFNFKKGIKELQE